MSLPYGVAIPACNAARTIEAAIASVLAQTLPPAAIVVVDDGSTDKTAGLAAAFGPAVRVVTQENRGPAAATDRCFDLLDTPLLAGLDADDLWRPEKAERQVEALRNTPHLDAVFCRAGIFAHGEVPGSTARSQELWGRSALMIRREAARRLGPVASDAGDRELGEMIRWIDRGRRLGLAFRLLPAVLVDRRIIAGSLSHGRSAAALIPALRDRLRSR